VETPTKRQDCDRRDQELPDEGVAGSRRKGLRDVERASVAGFGDLKPRLAWFELARETLAEARVFRAVRSIISEVDRNSVVDFVLTVRNYNVGCARSVFEFVGASNISSALASAFSAKQAHAD